MSEKIKNWVQSGVLDPRKDNGLEQMIYGTIRKNEGPVHIDNWMDGKFAFILFDKNGGVQISNTVMLDVDGNPTFTQGVPYYAVLYIGRPSQNQDGSEEVK